jgi:hypothetical protein
MDRGTGKGKWREMTVKKSQCGVIYVDPCSYCDKTTAACWVDGERCDKQPTTGSYCRGEDMLNVTQEKHIVHDPETATLWVDGTGLIAFLHHAPNESYQLTRLRDGRVIDQGKNKVRLVAGFCPLVCGVTIQNSCRAS